MEIGKADFIKSSEKMTSRTILMISCMVKKEKDEVLGCCFNPCVELKDYSDTWAVWSLHQGM